MVFLSKCCDFDVDKMCNWINYIRNYIMIMGIYVVVVVIILIFLFVCVIGLCWGKKIFVGLVGDVEMEWVMCV